MEDAVSIRTIGGLAHLPGLAEGFSLDVGRMSRTDAEAVGRAVISSRFFDRPEPEARMAARDVRTHVVSIRLGGRVRSLAIIEPIEDEALGALVRILRDIRTRHAP